MDAEADEARRRAVARAAAADAAEGERRRRISIMQLEELEEIRLRRWMQRAAIAAMERERERRVEEREELESEGALANSIARRRAQHVAKARDETRRDETRSSARASVLHLLTRRPPTLRRLPSRLSARGG